MIDYARVLLTGVNGLLGQALARQLGQRPSGLLLATGHQMESRIQLEPGVRYVCLDIRDAEGVRNLIAEYEPEWVINCAAKTNVDACESERSECWEVNAQGVENLAHGCRNIGARLIQVSTDFVCDGTQGRYTETDRPHPVNFYGKSKLAGENNARTAGGGRWTVVRTGVIYGRATGLPKPDFVGWVRQKLGAGESLCAFTDQWRTPTYTHDIALGISQIVQRRSSGVYHLAGRDYLSMYDFAHEVAAAYGLDALLIQGGLGSESGLQATRPPRTGLVTQKAERELDYRPMSLSQALKHASESHLAILQTSS